MQITLDTPLDMHLHLRDGEMARLVTPCSARTFAGAVIMPNLVPPVTDSAAMRDYAERILQAADGCDFRPYMTLFFKNQTRQELETALANPLFFGLKLYPAGATTNSEGGVKNLGETGTTLHLMEEMGIPLLIHGESHGFVMDREQDFLPVYRNLATRFPKLKISMEHITTAAALELLDAHENLHATVTLQHLLITLDDLAGGMLKPHLFCKPIAKRPADRDALLQAALSGHPKLMFGSDSAPHPIHKKECCGCAAGVFTAPFALAKLAETFATHQSLDNLQAFVSGNARRIYALTPPDKTVTLVDTPMTIPAAYRGYGQEIVPMDAGHTIGWSVA
ncbi:dihydroorotase [Akkermansia glycaniphila]|uniref:Dihydroorotase n=1 Tax=Akkermansia glycaniphila TaxID=1679444 RepID=A0A1C7PAI0_9BACT|nr:dihydroorotase [Akkermansia glycaniphila]OCA02593.1 dihydroorotase [Akkermansia glycaniphila]SEH78820.1 metal-dependent hydrolase [Akkermansia glycaniphila]